MTPKEKGNELVEKLRLVISCMDGNGISFSATDEDGKDISEDCKIDAYLGSLGDAKKCALICVEEIIEVSKNYSSTILSNGMSDYEYWQQVKTEIENL